MIFQRFIQLPNSSNKEINYSLIEGDLKRTPFYTHIKLDKGNYKLSVRQPRNISTFKISN